MDIEAKWYLIQCKPGESFRAAENLQNQNYTFFHPTHPLKRKKGSTVYTVLAPLFPHYLFILLDETDNWSAIRSTRGVSRMVRFNGVPASLEKHIAEELQRQCARLNGVEAPSIYKVGDRVMITDSCFKELEAIVTATSGDERVTLLINLFNRPQYVELSVGAVAAIS